MPGFGKVYYDEDAVANIFGFSDLKKKHRITYDSEKEDAFLVHKDNEIIKFECSPDGLYQYRVTKGYQDSLKKEQEHEGTSNLVSTVTENRKGYTLRQFERAKEARRLYHIVGTPTVAKFKLLLRMDAIKNCPVTVEDINISKRIFGQQRKLWHWLQMPGSNRVIKKRSCQALERSIMMRMLWLASLDFQI